MATIRKTGVRIHGGGIWPYGNNPHITMALSYNDVITRTGNTISLTVSAANLEAFNRKMCFGFFVYAQLGNGEKKLLIDKPYTPDRNNKTVWDADDYVLASPVVLTEDNATTSTSLKIIMETRHLNLSGNYVGCGCYGPGSSQTNIFYPNRHLPQVVAEYALTAPSVLDSYTVTFNANGGSNPPGSLTKIEATPLKLTGAVPTGPKKTVTLNAQGGSCSVGSVSGNRNFASWNNQADGKGSISLSAKGEYTQDSDVTLYAQWGGLTLPALPEVTKTHHPFVGWFTSPNCEGTMYKEGDVLPASVTTLYAGYKYTVYYVFYPLAEDEQIYTAYKEHDVSLTIISQHPSKTGYTFVGWTSVWAGTSVEYEAGDKYTANAPVTLYPVFRLLQYTVTYDYAGGVDSQGNTSKQVTVNWGDAPTYPTDVTRPGYYFNGWSQNAGPTITGNITITANWVKCALHKFDEDSGWQGFQNTEENIWRYNASKKQWERVLKLKTYSRKSATEGTWEDQK